RWRLSRTRVPRLRASRPGAGGSGDRQTLGSGQRLRRLAETLGGGKGPRNKAPKFLEDMPAKQFLDGTPKQTAWWFECACYVLSHKLTNGVRQRKSFAEWLVPEMIQQSASSHERCPVHARGAPQVHRA